MIRGVGGRGGGVYRPRLYWAVGRINLWRGFSARYGQGEKRAFYPE